MTVPAEPNMGKTAITFSDKNFSELENIYEINKATGKIDPQYTTFKESIRNRIDDLHMKAFFVLFAIRKIGERVNNEQVIRDHLAAVKEDLVSVINNSKRTGEFVIRFIDKELLFLLDSLLVEIKSFMDLLAQILAKSLGIAKSVHTFSRKEIQKDGEKTVIIGGQFIDVLENNTPKESKPDAVKIVEILNRHKASWIDDTVHLRDSVTHYRTLLANVLISSETFRPPIQGFTVSWTLNANSLTDFVERIRNGFILLNQEIREVLRA